MSKFLLIVIAFAAAFWLLRNRFRRADRSAERPPDPGAEDMVDCAHCGLHLPRGEGVLSGPRYFCSTEHEREFQAKR